MHETERRYREIDFTPIQYLDSNLRERIHLPKYLKEIELDIDEALSYFYRSKKNIPLIYDRRTEDHYRGNCNTATQKFGEILAKQEGEEDKKGFFDRHDGSQYFDIRSDGPFKENYGRFHSVGMIQIPGKLRGNYYVILDLTHNAVDNQNSIRTLVIQTRCEEEAYRQLQDYYGGKWIKSFKLNPQKGTYEFIE